MNNEDVKFVFFGTGNVAITVLETLHKDRLVPELIITTPDKPRGRKMTLTPSPAKLWAQEYDIPFLQPQKLTHLGTEFPLGNSVPKLFIVAEYGKIIPKEVLDIPEFGTLNVHPSLLPKFRGPSPIKSFMLSEEKETGTTIISMDEEVDHGPIVAQASLSLGTEFPSGNSVPKWEHTELEKKLAELGGKLLIDVIPKWIKGKIKAQEQNHKLATFTQKITKEDGLINPTDSSELIDSKVKALTPWPGAYFFIKKQDKNFRIIITESEVKDNKLVIKKVKPEGKNEMNFNDFLKGNPDIAEQLKRFSNLSF